MEEQFLCSADVKGIERRDEPWIPDDALNFSPEEWKCEKRNVGLSLLIFSK